MSGNITNFAVVIIVITFFDVFGDQIGIEAGILVWIQTTCAIWVDNNCFQAAWWWFVCPTPIQDVSNYNFLVRRFINGNNWSSGFTALTYRFPSSLVPLVVVRLSSWIYVCFVQSQLEVTRIWVR